MVDEKQAKDGAPDKHAQVMERYRAMDLAISDRGNVELTSDQQRRVYAYGVFADGLAPAHLKSWKEVEQGIQLIQGMGIPALSNLEFLYFVGGKLTAMHRLCLAACQVTGELEKHHVVFVDAQNEPLSDKNVVGFKVAACVVYVRRRGQENDAVGAFTIADAEAAGLLTRNKVWQVYPKDMLFHRASMRALSQQFSDVLGGVRCKELEEYNLVVDEQGQPAKSADGHQIFQKKLARLRESEKQFAKTIGGATST